MFTSVNPDLQRRRRPMNSVEKPREKRGLLR
jgi:hypothetical protein